MLEDKIVFYFILTYFYFFNSVKIGTQLVYFTYLFLIPRNSKSFLENQKERSPILLVARRPLKFV